MSSDARLRVVLLWHMHQPDYRIDGIPQQPWVHLHALRGYADMASHLEAVSGARAVVNFSPVLLDQLADTARQLREMNPVDPLLKALLECPAGEARTGVLSACLRAHEHHGYARFPEYARLAWQAADALNHGPDTIAELPQSFIQDLVVWYYLVWTGEHARRTDPRVATLAKRATGYSDEERRTLFEFVAETVAGIIPRYRKLAETGRVELSMSPYFHPLLPLLLDFRSARENAPDAELPPAAYPDGAARARWHLCAGRERFIEAFGAEPRGCWPSEAALSEETIRLIETCGFDWTVSAESVLRATLHRHGITGTDRAGVWRRDRGRLSCFFRDDGLSDRIGFVYKDWRPQDAVNDLVAQLESEAEATSGQPVVIALDGENPWEYYPENGIEFVRGLYAALSGHPRLQLATLSECVDDDGLSRASLPPVVAGSWVHGQVLTWIGHPDKNHAWQLLIEAKRRFDAADTPSAKALYALGACESSDWFWWPGAHNPPPSVADFDNLFRAHLRCLYRLLGETVPAALEQPFAGTGTGGGAALGAMLPSQ
jgi:alpha-amylase/alpha-mannosidase (GH57 family)